VTSPFDTSVPLTEEPQSPLFDMYRRGSRASTFRFDLVGIDGYRDPTPLTPLKGSSPTLSHDTGRTIKRTLSLALGVVDTARFDPIYHRVEPVMVMDDGLEFPLGRYMTGDRTSAGSTAGDQASLSLTDEFAQVNQQIEQGFSALQQGSSQTISGNGQNIRVIVLALLDKYTLFNPINLQGALSTGVTSFPQTGGHLVVEADVEGTQYSTDAAWQAGTAGGSIIEALAVAGDYWSPWIGNDKSFHMIRTFDPMDRVPLVDWDRFGEAIRGSVAYSDDLLIAPNRFIVVSNQGVGASADRPVVGRYDVPAAAPWSIARRGFVIPSYQDIQLRDDNQATAVARSLGRRQTVFERAQVSTPPDPRHDSYDVVLWRGERWLELAWTMTLLEGAPMQHTLRKVYDDNA
jgi:hypothetical protein